MKFNKVIAFYARKQGCAPKQSFRFSIINYHYNKVKILTCNWHSSSPFGFLLSVKFSSLLHQFIIHMQASTSKSSCKLLTTESEEKQLFPMVWLNSSKHKICLTGYRINFRQRKYKKDKFIFFYKLYLFGCSFISAVCAVMIVKFIMEINLFWLRFNSSGKLLWFREGFREGKNTVKEGKNFGFNKH